MKLSKKQARLRRATKFRAKHAARSVERLCVYKTSQHIYAQIISGCGTKTLASASTLTAKVRMAVMLKQQLRLALKLPKQQKKQK